MRFPASRTSSGATNSSLLDWVEISTLSVIGLLLVQPILRAYQRAKTPKDSLTLIDKALLADLLLLLLWITALFVAAARSGAGASG